MTFAETRPARTSGRRALDALGLLVRALGHFSGAVLMGWATLAIYYSNLPWSWL